MRKRRRNPEQFPRAVIRKALAAARVFAADVGAVSVAVGHKHDRVAGYGTRSRVSIKFLVTRKRKISALAARRRVRKHVRVEHRGTVYRVPTDVSEIGSFRQHGAPPIYVDTGEERGPRGSPGTLLKGSNRKIYLLTAGHVLFAHKPSNPWSVHPVPVYVANARAGDMIGDATYFQAGRMLIDVGLVEVDPSDQLKGVLTRRPWIAARAIASEDVLRSMVRADQAPVACTVFGLKNTPTALLDAVSEVGLPTDDFGIYAPLMLKFRAQDAPFSGGDSGACAMTDEGLILGIHVLGSDAKPYLGWSMALSSVLRYLSVKTGVRYALFRPARSPR